MHHDSSSIKLCFCERFQNIFAIEVLALHMLLLILGILRIWRLLLHKLWRYLLYNIFGFVPIAVMLWLRGTKIWKTLCTFQWRYWRGGRWNWIIHGYWRHRHVYWLSRLHYTWRLHCIDIVCIMLHCWCSNIGRSCVCHRRCHWNFGGGESLSEIYLWVLAWWFLICMVGIYVWQNFLDLIMDLFCVFAPSNTPFTMFIWS